MEREHESNIEEAIDDLGLSGLLEKVAEIAREKADHIRQAYGDRSLARMWESDAGKIETLAGRLKG